MLAGLCVAWWWQRRDAAQLGERAYEETRVIVAKGPRPPESKALDEVRAHVGARLKANGWATRSEVFERQTPRGVMRFEQDQRDLSF